VTVVFVVLDVVYHSTPWLLWITVRPITKLCREGAGEAVQ